MANPPPSKEEVLYVPMLAEAFHAVGLPAEWGPAIARQESAFRPDATNMTGGDLKRGGAWGLCQMTYATAVGLGFTGDATELLDPYTNVRLAAQLCARLAKRFKGSLIDVASAYNSGRPYSRAGLPTQRYALSVVRHAATYKYHPAIVRLTHDGSENLT